MNLTANQSDLRLDVYLVNNTEYSRSTIQKLIKEGNVLVNNKIVKSSYVINNGDEIVINYEPPKNNLKKEAMDLEIVYEDDDLAVINKPNGLVVHPGNGNESGTLANGLSYHFNELSDINGEERPGIVHRIDAYTTGLLVIAKNDIAHQKLAKQLEDKTLFRLYYALVDGVIENDTGSIDAPIGRDKKDRKKMAVIAGGKRAVTHFKVLERYNNATLIEIRLETGRTHQIRVHMQYINHPVINDPVYGNHKLIDNTGQCLHAKELGFIHPKTGKKMHFECDLPDCFINILNIFKSK